MYTIDKIYNPDNRVLSLDVHDLFSLFTILNVHEDIDSGLKSWLYNEPKYYATQVDKHLLEVAVSKVLDNLNLTLEMALYEKSHHKKTINVEGYQSVEKIIITAQTQNQLYVIEDGMPGVLTVFARYYIHKSSQDSIEELRNLAKVIGWASGMHTILAALLIDTIKVERYPSIADDNEIVQLLSPLLDLIEYIAQLSEDDKTNQLKDAFKNIESLYQEYADVIRKYKEFENKLTQLKQYATGLSTTLGVEKFDYIGTTQKIKMYSVNQKYFDDKALAQENARIV
jgi:hypothetical protein